ncbi:hypothetical protein [Alicycliphilus denitrificans]|uniref:hypothetical protein n=1 Tax=Alicycliphilus denitrificans TaxID=179636 RepID=UPI00384B4918
MPSSLITIAQPNPDGSLPIPAPPESSATEQVQAQLQQQTQALQQRLQDLQALLDKPLSAILAEHDKALEAAAAWDAFGAQWLLAQRAMRRVALDLAAAQGLDEATVVARAMAHANAVLNSEDEDLGGSIAPAQLAHIARHKAYLRKQFRQG